MDHEFTHAAVLRGLGATSLPTWLAEGTASYEARLLDPASWDTFEPYVRAGRIPAFSALEDGSSYGDNGGYFWSYTIVDFAMATYGAVGRVPEGASPGGRRRRVLTPMRGPLRPPPLPP